MLRDRNSCYPNVFAHYTKLNDDTVTEYSTRHLTPSIPESNI